MLDIIAHGDVAELRLNRPPVNALNHGLLEALLSAQRESLKQGARGLILSGREGMFSAGLDVPELLGCERASITRFWSLLFEATRSLLSCPVPVAAAVTGHSPAGGAVLAIHCDYRVAAEGAFRIGLNEVRVGLTLPPPIMQTFAEIVGTRQARRLGTEGVLLSMDEALRVGLVDELVPAPRVVPRSLEYLQGLLALPPVAMNETRLLGKAPSIAALESAGDVERATAAWFSAETQSSMRALADSLKKN